jgi:hypothetical protein
MGSNNETGCVKVISIVAGIATIIGVIFAIVAWLMPFSPVGSSPIAPVLTDIPFSSPTNTPKPIQIIEDFQTVSLESKSEMALPETNLGLAPGLNYLLDIPFETGWKFSTQCSHIPERPTIVTLNANISSPHYVYILLQAGWGSIEYRDIQIGNIKLNFSDGSIIDTSLSLGYNIRDWSRDDPQAVTTVFSTDLQPAWEGTAPDGRLGGMDILTIRIPEKKDSLTNIEISDVSQTTAGSMNPCIHIMAVTVKHFREE